MKATQTWNNLKTRERSRVIDLLNREAHDLEFEHEEDSFVVLAFRVAAELLQDAVKKK